MKTRSFLTPIFGISTLLLSLLPAMADLSPVQYNTPPFLRDSDIGAPRRTQGAGSRGCEANATPVHLTLLAPTHTGGTVSRHPSFYWYVSSSTPVSISFTLVEPRVDPPLLEREVALTKGGIVRLEMPENAPELQEGKEYRWTVAVICDPNRPSTNIVARSLIQRVAISPELESQLAAASSDYERGVVYAEAGYWYDALDAIALTYSQQPNATTLDNLLSLLQQAEVPEITTQDWQNYTKF